MSEKEVLIIGGQGRIGKQVAADLRNHYPSAQITITSRQPHSPTEGFRFLCLDLEDSANLTRAIATADLVIHCAGPFHHRDGRVLKTCIDQKVNYIDVSDHPSFYEQVSQLRAEATASGITAIVNTGIFPGISNSMVREGIEALDQGESIHISYIVGGSGGAGLTVLKTTFLGLKEPFQAWLQGKWQTILPYTEREEINFPPPYGKTGVYWFNMPETYTLAESFPVQTVITKFGSLPDFYNHLTWITAHIFPASWVTSPKGIEFFARVSQFMTKITDKFSGIGVAMRVEIKGQKDNQAAIYTSTMVHENTAIAAGAGTGSVAQLLLTGALEKPGVWPVEQILPTNLFRQAMSQRGININSELRYCSTNLDKLTIDPETPKIY